MIPILDWIFEGIVNWIASIASTILDAVSGLFLEALGTDMTAMEEYFPFITKAYSTLQYTAWAILFLVVIWQLFRAFGGPITEAENPWHLVIRGAIYAFLIGYAKPIAMFCLEIARVPYTSLMEVSMTGEDFTFAGVEEVLTNGLTTIVAASTVAGLILVLILLIALGWNYFKLLLETVERYIVVGVLSYTSPLAFSMGGSKTTNNVFKSWCRMVGSQLILLVMNVWFLRGFASSMGHFIGNGGALTNGKGSIRIFPVLFLCPITLNLHCPEVPETTACLRTSIWMRQALLAACPSRKAPSTKPILHPACLSPAGRNPLQWKISLVAIIRPAIPRQISWQLRSPVPRREPPCVLWKKVSSRRATRMGAIPCGITVPSIRSRKHRIPPWKQPMVFSGTPCSPNLTGIPSLEKTLRENVGDTGKHNGSNSDIEDGYAHTGTASDGDVIDYQIVSTLPSITSEATYLTAYTFVDTLSKGITYNKNDVILEFFSDADCTKLITTWDESDGKFSVSYNTTSENESVMTIEMTSQGLTEINTSKAVYTEAGMVNSGFSDCTVRITYKATVNSDASVVYGDNGNPNEVVLLWKRSSQDYYDTLVDDAHVYVYGLELTKLFSDGKGIYYYCANKNCWYRL